MYVYIIQSTKNSKFYCGQSSNINDRLNRHNSGRSKYTKSGKPWKLVHLIEVNNRSIAMKLESKIKKRGIERYMKDNNIVI